MTAVDGSSRSGLALLGCGTVGAEVVRLLHEQADDLTRADRRAAGTGRDRGTATRPRPRRLPVDPALFTTDALGLVKRDDVDVVVEVVGGIEPARTWLVEALRAGKSVVTANKALLAEDGGTLHDAAAEGGADLYYEAAVAGAIPLLRPLRESLHGDTHQPGHRHRQRHHQLHPLGDGRHRRRLHRGAGGGDRARATRRPTRPPTSRASTRRRRRPSWPRWPSTPGSTAADVYREGITEVTAADMASAKAMGCTIKLLCIAERGPDATGRSRSASACTRR